MPRNSSGVYSLPAGNPVVTGTVISSTWANTTLTDIANEITQSLDRSGDGGMLAGLQLFSGTAGAPGLTWSSETTSGLYRSAAGDFRYSIGGADKFQITTNGIRAADGAVATPSFSFLTDTNTGLYLSAADTLAVSSGGTIGMSWLLSGAVVQSLSPDGTNLLPSLAFRSDVDTGIYWISANNFGLSTGGVNQLTISTGSLSVQPQRGIGNSAGSAGTPSYSFATDPDTGMWTSGANTVSFATNGVNRIDLDTAAMVITLPIRQSNGTEAAPAYSFSGDTNTGMYAPAANRLGLVVDGVTYIELPSAQQVLHVSGSVSNPGVAFIEEPDTGMYLATAGPAQLNFAVDGAVGLAIAGSSFSMNPGSGTYTWNLNNVGLAGSASAGAATLPANPVGFIAVVIAGTARRIPYYAS